jgi:serine/threonine protein kinase
MDRKWLDRITEEGAIKCYSENELVNRTFVGSGAFGAVFRATLKHSGITVAIKMMSIETYEDEQELYRKFIREVRIIVMLLYFQ